MPLRRSRPVGRTGSPSSARTGGYYDYSILDQGNVERYGAAPRDYSTDVVGRAARGFLKSPGIQDGSRPFFLYYAPFAPHGRWVPGPRDLRVQAPVPFESPAFDEPNVSDKPAVRSRCARRWRAKRVRRLTMLWNSVYGTLRDVDRWVGRFQRVLPPSVLDNTVLIFMSDNGVEWGDHGLTYKGYPYERSIAVPLIFAGPQIVHGVNHGLASNLDIAPTIADLTGGFPPGPLTAPRWCRRSPVPGPSRRRACCSNTCRCGSRPRTADCERSAGNTSSIAAAPKSSTTCVVIRTSCGTSRTRGLS